MSQMNEQTPAAISCIQIPRKFYQNVNRCLNALCVKIGASSSAGSSINNITTHTVTIQILLTVCQMQFVAKGGRYCS